MKHRIYLIIASIMTLAVWSSAMAQESSSAPEGCHSSSCDFYGAISGHNDSVHLSSVVPLQHSSVCCSHSKDKTEGNSWSAIASPTVYICTGSKSYAYHKKSKCRGLNNCQSEIIAVSESDAKNAGYRKCKICYR